MLETREETYTTTHTKNRYNELGNNTGMLKAVDCYGIPDGNGNGGFSI